MSEAERESNTHKKTDKEINDRLNSFNEDIRILENKIDSKTYSTSRKIYAFLFLTILVMIVLLIYTNSSLNNNINSLQASINKRIITQVNTMQSLKESDIPDRFILFVKDKLNTLEFRQDAILSEAQNSMERIYFVFTTVAAFFGLFALYFGYRQIVLDSNRDTHDQEMRNLVKSFQDNIKSINSLIHILESSYSYQEKIKDQIQDVRESADRLQMHREELDRFLNASIDDLNVNAVKIFLDDIDRAKLSREEDRRKIEKFSNKFTNIEDTRDIKGKLNPFCYFVRGLGKTSIYQYESSFKDFKNAYKGGIEDSLNDLHKLKEGNYKNVTTISKMKEDIKKMMLSCFYFQGIGYKNLGEYAKSQEMFRKALLDDPKHLQSKTYLLQVMFFDLTVPFESIEREYEKAIIEFQELEREPNIDKRSLKKSFSLLKINQGDLYLDKAIHHLDFREKYKKNENSEKAIRCYWEAYDTLKTDLSMLAIAQAMDYVGPSEWRGRKQDDFFNEVMHIVKKRVTEDHDKLYAVVLYYMLAICARKLNLGDNATELYLSQARHSLKEVPSHITCFSPINRIRLTRSQILEEMEIFERKR